MQITAAINNAGGRHQVTVATAGNSKELIIPGKPSGGSSVNGGELLFLALATCFCNDVYREAARRQMTIEAVDVTVEGNFGNEGEPGSDIRYFATVSAPSHTPEEIADLVTYVDRIAEIHNTLRQGVPVTIVR